jgi:hypothetical protein
MMHRSIQRLVAIGIAAMIPSVALAVNCDQVRRYLAAGRSVQDVADSMIIDVKDVQKCQQQPGAQEGTAPDAVKAKEAAPDKAKKDAAQ